MFPAYKYVDTQPQSFPNPGNYMPCPYHYYPGQGAFPPQGFSSTHGPTSFAPWPYNGNMIAQSNECNGCCFHSHPTRCCNYMPPYPPMQQPPRFYYHGTHPHHDPYPTYFVPPYHFDQVRHDNDVVKSNCCGCPNHPCKRMDNQSRKIEEHNPEGEQKNDGSSGLIHPPDYHHPVVWVPASLFNNKEADKNPQHPLLLKGWIPLDMNSFKNLTQPVDQKDKVLADKKNQFSWPFIWKPGQDDSEVFKDLKDISGNPQPVEQTPSQLKIIPLRLLENGSPGDKPGTLEDQSKPSGDKETLSAKESKTKIIPVKQLDEIMGKNISSLDIQNVKNGEKKPSILEKEKEDGKKISESKQSAQAKSPKLSPICLRVDPLPKNKSTNGASRSPSPPGRKDEQRSRQDETQGKPSPIDRKDGVLRKEIQVTDSNQNSEAIEVNGKSQNTSNLMEKPGSAVERQQQKASLDEETDKVLEVSVRNEQKDNTDEGKISHESTKTEGENPRKEALQSVGSEKKECKILSPMDAAVLIQSAYRGFEVRRWRPLEKLRKIKNIRERLEDVRMQIQDLEAPSVDMNKKQLMVIGETVMSLLLQLDTVQGLHHSVREARKAVTKDLINLQEKLDYLNKQAKSVQTKKDDGSRSSSSLDVAGCEADPSAVETLISQDSNELTQNESKSEATSVDTQLEGQERHVNEEISKSSDLVADTTESLAGGAVSSALSKEDEESHCSNEEQGSEVDKPLVGQSQREKTSSDMEISLVDEAVRMHPVLSNDDQSSCVEYETSVKNEESEKQSASKSGDTIKEASPSDGGMVSNMRFLDSANIKDIFLSDCSDSADQASDSETELVKNDVLVESNVEADEKPEATLEQVSVLPVVGEKTGAPIAEESDFTSKVAGSVELLSEQMQPVNESKAPELEAASAVSESAMVGDCVRDNNLPSTMDEGIIMETVDVPFQDHPVGTEDGVDLAAYNDGGNLAHDAGNALAAEIIPRPGLRVEEKKLLEENEKLREALERLLEVGKSNLGQISDLNGRIKDLEKKLAQKKKVRAKRYRVRRSPPHRVAS